MRSELKKKIEIINKDVYFTGDYRESEDPDNPNKSKIITLNGKKTIKSKSHNWKEYKEIMEKNGITKNEFHIVMKNLVNSFVYQLKLCGTIRLPFFASFNINESKSSSIRNGEISNRVYMKYVHNNPNIYKNRKTDNTFFVFPFQNIRDICEYLQENRYHKLCNKRVKLPRKEKCPGTNNMYHPIPLSTSSHEIRRRLKVISQTNQI